MVIARQPFVENGYLSLRFPNMVKVSIHEHWTRVTRFNPYEFLIVYSPLFLPPPLSLIKTNMVARNAANFRVQCLRWLLFFYEIFEGKNSLILYVVLGFECPRHRPKRVPNDLRTLAQFAEEVWDSRYTYNFTFRGTLRLFFLWNNYSKKLFVSPRPEQFVFMFMSSRLLRTPLKNAKKKVAVQCRPSSGCLHRGEGEGCVGKHCAKIPTAFARTERTSTRGR